MLKATCIDRKRNKNNIVQLYVLQLSTGELGEVSAYDLKKALKNREIVIDNLTLTSDDRIISREPYIGKRKRWKNENSVMISVKEISNLAREKNLSFKTNVSLNNMINKARLLDATIHQIKNNLIAIENKDSIIIATDLDIIRFSSNAEFFFYNKNFTSIDLSNVNTSNISNARLMFANTEIKKLNIANMNTEKMINTSDMFTCIKLPELDLSNFNTHNVTEMFRMFFGVTLNNLNLSSFNTSKVISMTSMFEYAKLPKLDLRNFNTSNVKHFEMMFSNSKIGILDISNFNMNNAEDVDYMFMEAKINKLHIGEMDVSKAESADSMFDNCEINELIIDKFIKLKSVESNIKRKEIIEKLSKSIDNWEEVKNKFRIPVETIE